MESELYDCIVVGGGLSGANAARILKDDGKKVLLLEARDRMGGRLLSKQVTLHNYLYLHHRRIWHFFNV